MSEVPQDDLLGFEDAGIDVGENVSSSSENQKLPASPADLLTNSLAEQSPTGSTPKPDPIPSEKTCLSLTKVVTMLNKALPSSMMPLIYWENVRQSAMVFASVLMILLSCATSSLISVLAYGALALLAISASFRIFKWLQQLLNKSSDSQSIRDVLDKDLQIPEAAAHDLLGRLIGHLNCGLKRFQHIILLEEPILSFKFAVVMYLLTYLGAMCNLITLLLLSWLSLFTLPKVYATYQREIDAALNMLLSKACDLYHQYAKTACQAVQPYLETVKAKLPWLKQKSQ